MTEFKGYPKTPRLYRDVVITEKIDGTNACVAILPFKPDENGDWPDVKNCIALVSSQEGMVEPDLVVFAQSRNRIITPEQDNYGFAAWVSENAEDLVDILGVGRWYGEWWGKGIQRGYGADRKYFSLFAGEEARLLKRWSEFEPDREHDLAMTAQSIGLKTVPFILTGVLTDDLIEEALGRLGTYGSFAYEGFYDPEGIIVYHTQSRQVYKVLLEDDHLSKTEAGVS